MFFDKIFYEADGTNAPTDTSTEEATTTEETADTILGTKPSEVEGSQIPETYDLASIIPEWFELDQTRMDSFTELAKESGLSQENASKLAAYGIQLMQESAQAVQQEFSARVNTWGEQAKTELGAEFNNTVRLAASGIEVMEKQIPELRTMLNETGAGNHPVMIKAMAMIGKLVAEENGSKLLGGQPQAGNTSIYSNTNFKKY